MDTMTLISEGTFAAACAAADCAVTAADLVLDGAPAAYAAVRPPGHHAGPGVLRRLVLPQQRGGRRPAPARRRGRRGIAQGGDRRHRRPPGQRHAGDLLRPRRRVLRQRARRPGGRLVPAPRRATPTRRARARAPAATATRSVAPGAGDDPWLAALDELLDDVRAFGPDALVVSLGVDAAVDDPESPLQITAAGYGAAGERLGALGLPTVLVQEGGYHLPTLGALVLSVLTGVERGAGARGMAEEPPGFWVGTDETGGIPNPGRPAAAPPPHWRWEAIAATGRPRSVELAPDGRRALMILDVDDAPTCGRSTSRPGAPTASRPVGRRRRTGRTRPRAWSPDETLVAFTAGGGGLARPGQRWAAAPPAPRALRHGGWTGAGCSSPSSATSAARSSWWTSTTRGRAASPAARVTVGAVAVAPDGARVAFELFPRDDLNACELHVVAAAGGSSRPLVAVAGMQAAVRCGRPTGRRSCSPARSRAGSRCSRSPPAAMGWRRRSRSPPSRPTSPTSTGRPAASTSSASAPGPA